MTTTSTATETRFSALATSRGANERLEHEYHAGRWPLALPLPRVRAVRRLRLHPGSRCTFRYAVAGWPETGECIAKVYAHPLPPAAQTLATLQVAGFAAPGRYRVPEVIVALPELRLVLTRIVPGVSLALLLQDGDLDAAARAGEWLAAFHAAPLALPPAYELRDPLAQAARYAARLARHLPALADRARVLHARLLDARPPWPGDLRLIHGDLGAAHVFVAADATTVIDWDSCRAGDPAEDAGRLIASLWHLAARGRITHDDAAEAERRFRLAYNAALAQPQVAARLPFYAALAGLRKASRIAQHDEHPHARHVSALLAAGLAALDGAG